VKCSRRISDHLGDGTSPTTPSSQQAKANLKLAHAWFLNETDGDFPQADFHAAT